ncbi:MAG: 4-hydroxybenzoate octaprenyltransferase [Asticcacaulis sp.]
MPAPATAPLPDASKLNWVDRFAPPHLRPWLKLGRFDRPVGIWLLFLPGAMGLAYATTGIVSRQMANGIVATSVTPDTLWHFPFYELMLFFVGAALMRAAGCAYNDFVDRDIDARVERTRGRPIPSGQVRPKQALVFAAGCSLISFLILIQLGQLAIILGICSVGLVAAYPFMKRITWWPQAWLGLTFNWGFPMAVAAVTKGLSWPVAIFYAGLVFWTIGYDTIYALQDIEDDAMIGVRSSARRLGRHTVTGVSLFYATAVLLTAIAGKMQNLPAGFFIGLLLVLGHLFWQVMNLKPEDGAGALKLFKSNRVTGLLWVLSLILVHWHI